MGIKQLLCGFLLALLLVQVARCARRKNKNRNNDKKEKVEVSNDDNNNNDKLMKELEELRHTVANLAKQTMSQQLFVEERIRSSGSSGIKQTRTRSLGNTNYHASTHISGGVAAIHDHANHKHAVGMGETVVVLNGVEFRTRHNDYKVVRASTTNKTYGVIEYIETPDVPPEVLRQKTVKGQIDEMKEWFKAFHFQNHTVRDYRKYFKPVMCYLEGAWTLDKELNEPFESDRHELVAETWGELQQQIRYTSSTGNKDLKENFSFLPTTIVGVDTVTGKPKYAQWNYRILCHPTSMDIPTKYFRQQDDFAYRESTRRTMSKVKATRAARFRLSEYAYHKFTGTNTLLDNIMKEIPGKDNIPDMLNEAPFGIYIFDTRYSNNTFLNTGYYHRSFRTGKRGAMGLMNVYRGFSDEFLFVAETTQPNIATESHRLCKNGRNCVTRSTGFTYAIPLEVIYLSPLAKWNPYKIPIRQDKDIVQTKRRRGGVSKDRAFNGTFEGGVYYMTPVEFYSSSKADEDDPADTTKFGVGVLDGSGDVHRMAGSGTRVLSLPISGAGRIRLRYPIMPIHGEGSNVWKELSVVKKKITKVEAINKASHYLIEVPATSVSGLHKHSFYLTLDQWSLLENEETVSVTTTIANGHSHEMDIKFNPRKKLEYRLCDNRTTCWDKHYRRLIIKETPSS